MPSLETERALADVLRAGRALLKSISANDVGLTGSHQYGYYIPVAAAAFFTPFDRTRGVNNDHPVNVHWPDGRVTESVLKWYGDKSRREYRLTRFGRGTNFPYLDHDLVGALLVLVPESHTEIRAHVLDLEEDIEDLTVELGVELIQTWAIYERDRSMPPETENACLDRKFRELCKSIENFPSTAKMASDSHNSLLECIKAFSQKSLDDQLLRSVEAEYELFKMVERKICSPQVTRLFASLDDFLEIANSIMNRRKSRAGRSLELHVCRVLAEAGVPFEFNPNLGRTKPDIVIPSSVAYYDNSYPLEKMFLLGIKTSCRDRWRQVTKEGPRFDLRHILTLQKGISPKQLTEMKQAGVQLVVPKSIHSSYPTDWRDSIFTVDGFVRHVEQTLSN